ncbi:MAG: type II toxin-antitoxin system RelE/ParE family toxin [Candidatus Hydrothermarchaeota archaeon]|nr:type II toxin-antitoxin system RelE/ParE family toxin [Candidatus Hydrothermarchaeota archaeon]
MVIKEVVWAKSFEASFKKIRDRKTNEKIIKQIEKIIANPRVGKPLRCGLKGELSVRVKPYRLVYATEGEKLYLLKFFHREKGY